MIYENKLIHGDSLTVLRQMEPESVDAIITDPMALTMFHLPGHVSRMTQLLLSGSSMMLSVS